MKKMDSIHTTFDDAMASPDPAGQGVATRGGFDLPGGAPKETENALSGLPTQPTTVEVTDNQGGGAVTSPGVPDVTGGKARMIDRA